MDEPVKFQIGKIFDEPVLTRSEDGVWAGPYYEEIKAQIVREISNKHTETLPEYLLSKFPSGKAPLANDFSVTDYSTQNSLPGVCCGCGTQTTNLHTHICTKTAT